MAQPPVTNTVYHSLPSCRLVNQGFAVSRNKWEFLIDFGLPIFHMRPSFKKQKNYKNLWPGGRSRTHAWSQRLWPWWWHLPRCQRTPDSPSSAKGQTRRCKLRFQFEAIGETMDKQQKTLDQCKMAPTVQQEPSLEYPLSGAKIMALPARYPFSETH